MTASSGAAMGVVTTTVSPKGSGWRATHEALTRLARLRAGLDFEEGQQLRAAQLARVHERLGYGSFVEYIERLFGYAPRLTLEKLRVAGAERHVLRFEVSGDVLATFREAVARLRQEAGGSLDDDAVLLLMARQVLAGNADEGRASYQLTVTVCESCARATQTGCGEPVAIEPEIAEMARCDAQKLGHSTSSGARSPRASQTIPPAIRRTVLQRDHHRCQVPGCRHATFVDVHHLRGRAEGGTHDADNLLTLCGAHHRACHRGDLLIEKGPTGMLDFFHADGTTYGGAPSAGAIDVTARALKALRTLGFAERQAREALHGARAHVGTGESETSPTDHAQVESLIRGALELLTRNSWAKAS